MQRIIGERTTTFCITSTVKHGEGPVMLRGAFAIYKVGDLHQMKGKLNESGYHRIPQHYAVSSGMRLVGQDNHPKHTMPPTRQNLTQDLFLLWVFREGGSHTRHGWLMLVIGSLGAMLNFAKSQGTKPDDLIGERFTKHGLLVQCESMLVFVWPSDTYARWPDARPEQQINAVGQSKLYQKYIKSKEVQYVLLVMSWSAQSTDLNPIKLVRDELDQKFRAKQPTTIFNLLPVFCGKNAEKL